MSACHGRGGVASLRPRTTDMRRSAGGCYEIRGTDVRRVTARPVEADTLALWRDRREDLLRESASIADPDRRLTAEEASLWRAMWKELDEVDAAVARLDHGSGAPTVAAVPKRRGKTGDRRQLGRPGLGQVPRPGDPDHAASCRWEDEGGAPVAPPKENRPLFKAAVEAATVTTSDDTTAASEARWQAWLAKGRVQDLRTKRPAAAFTGIRTPAPARVRLRATRESATRSLPHVTRRPGSTEHMSRRGVSGCADRIESQTG